MAYMSRNHFVCPSLQDGSLRQVWDDGFQISSFLLCYVTLWRTVCRAYAIHAFPLLQHPNLLAYIHLTMIHANSTYVIGIIRYDGSCGNVKRLLVSIVSSATVCSGHLKEAWELFHWFNQTLSHSLWWTSVGTYAFTNFLLYVRPKSPWLDRLYHLELIVSTELSPGDGLQKWPILYYAGDDLLSYVKKTQQKCPLCGVVLFVKPSNKLELLIGCQVSEFYLHLHETQNNASHTV